MRDNPEGGVLNSADCVRRRCKKNSPFILSCIGKRTREDCDRGSEVGTIRSGRDGEGPVPPRKPKVSGRRERVVRKILSPRRVAGVPFRFSSQAATCYCQSNHSKVAYGHKKRTYRSISTLIFLNAERQAGKCKYQLSSLLV